MGTFHSVILGISKPERMIRKFRKKVFGQSKNGCFFFEKQTINLKVAGVQSHGRKFPGGKIQKSGVFVTIIIIIFYRIS